jgi:hypothetical protein
MSMKRTVGTYFLVCPAPSNNNIWSMCSFYSTVIAYLNNNNTCVEVMFDLLQQLNVDDASEFLEEGTPIIQNSTVRLEKSG